MEINVEWLNGKSFKGIGKAGSEILMDVPIEKEGQNLGPTPKEVFLMSVAGCSGMDIISILKKKRLDVLEFRIHVTAEEQTAEHPYVFTKAAIHYILKGKNLTEDAVKQAIDLSQEKYCGVSEMMRKAFPISFTFEFSNVKE
ncbi:MAG: OsmC family protein [bacterium]|nr:OsmC family protein [bacterium]